MAFKIGCVNFCFLWRMLEMYEKKCDFFFFFFFDE